MIGNHPLPIQLAKDSLDTSSMLKFPGKIAINSTGSGIAVSDTGNHRILLFNSAGIVHTIVGGEGAGFKDGAYDEALFNSPQGVTWYGDDFVFVADTENHAVRKVNIYSTTEFFSRLSLTVTVSVIFPLIFRVLLSI